MRKLAARGCGTSSANARTTIVVERQPDRTGVARRAKRVMAAFEDARSSLRTAAVMRALPEPDPCKARSRR
jgi:hypothetical protein